MPVLTVLLARHTGPADPFGKARQNPQAINQRLISG